MVEQWEMCKVDGYYNSVSFLTPEGATSFAFKDYLRTFDPSFKTHGMLEDSRLVFCKVLFEGWQPYTANGSGPDYYFRRLFSKIKKQQGVAAGD
jgi:hypothetical protein